MILPARIDAQSASGVNLNLSRVEGKELDVLAEILGDGSGNQPICGDFTVDGKGRLVSTTRMDNTLGYIENSIEIYDEDFNLITSIMLHPVITQKYESGSDFYGNVIIQFSVKHSVKSSIQTNNMVSQTLFNSDDRYELITPLYDDYFTNEKNGFSRKYVKGFRIVNDMGQVLCQQQFKTKYEYADNAVVFIVGDKKYLYFAYMDSFYNLNADCFLIEPEKSSLKRVELPKGLKAMPNVARASENVNLTFPEVAETRTVSLVNSSGRVVRTDRIAAGIGSYSLNTGNLAPGLYVVTLSDGTTSIETAKIIIR